MNWLKEELNKRNMTQKEFALRCNLSETAITCYVNEKYIPKLEHIYVMSRILTISVAQFVKGISKKEKQ